MAKRKLEETSVSDQRPPDEEHISESESEAGSNQVESMKIHGKPTKKQRKQITAQQIQVARETAELFKSNIFKLQIDELIRELKPKESHVLQIEKVLHRLHDLINQIPPLTDLSLAQVDRHFHQKKIVVPWPDPKPQKVNYKFSYVTPEDVSLIGSFGLKTGIQSDTKSSIDVALTMPRDLFQPKDYLNYRALYKKAFYIAYLAENLVSLTKKNHLPVKISYEYLNGDILNPMLHLESIKTDNPDDLLFKKFAINLIVGFPFGVFDNKKILPDKNCIRIQCDANENLPATPLYNSSIVASTAYDYYLKYLYTAKKSAEAFKDACILGRLWLQQRDMDSSINKGGFGHFEFAILIAALLHGGGVNGNKILLHGFSSYQLFKGAIKYLASMDLNKGYLSFSSLVGEPVTSKYISEGFNVPTLFDKNVKLNVLWKMTESSYTHLRRQAQDTLELLNDVVADRFDQILLQKSHIPSMKHDLLVSINIPESIQDEFSASDKIKFLTFNQWIKHRIGVILRRALSDRVTEIYIREENEPVVNFPLSKRKPNATAIVNGKQITSVTILVGFQLANDADKAVTKGPNSEEEEEGTRFRAFWGSKASLRRFKDGTIQNCAVWNATEEPIVLTITKYILNLHLKEGLSDHIYSASTLFNAKLPKAISGGSPANAFAALKNSFDGLCKIIGGLDLPLSIKAILPSSTGLRYSSLLQPVPFAVSSPDFWNEALLQFETSTKWPDELQALEKTKTAFLLKISDQLDQTAYRSFITKDESIPFIDITLLNILTPEGFGFRIRVLSERDEILYLRAVSNAPIKQKASIQDIYLKFNQKYIGAAKHTRTVSSLSHHFPAYSRTVRLFKRWLDAHLLLCHVGDELAELLTLKVFVDPAPYSIPQSAESGFLQILGYLSRWNWREIPLILDLIRKNDDLDDKLSEKLNIQSYRIIEKNFEKIRQNDPSCIKTQLFIGSKYDPSGLLWSNGLTLPICGRLTALARLSVQLISEQAQLDEEKFDLLFTPALQDYSFTINVKSSSITPASSGILPPNTFKNLVISGSSFPDDICTNYDLVQMFFNELEKKFGNCIIFSAPRYTALSKDGSSVISGLIVPAATGKKKFKVHLALDVKPESKDECSINMDSIFSQIELLGGDIIQSIQKN